MRNASMVVENHMRVNRSVPILLVGFGMLIGLMALTGVSALQLAR